MVSYKCLVSSQLMSSCVLILVVVEDGLVPDMIDDDFDYSKVLILVVVEDGLVRTD